MSNIDPSLSSFDLSDEQMTFVMGLAAADIFAESVQDSVRVDQEKRAELDLYPEDGRKLEFVARTPCFDPTGILPFAERNLATYFRILKSRGAVMFSEDPNEKGEISVYTDSRVSREAIDDLFMRIAAKNDLPPFWSTDWGPTLLVPVVDDLLQKSGIADTITSLYELPLL